GLEILRILLTVTTEHERSREKARVGITPAHGQNLGRGIAGAQGIDKVREGRESTPGISRQGDFPKYTLVLFWMTAGNGAVGGTNP
ncbi:MAG: hypothetical protein OEO83_18910, partial [Alphaproteobacteria bacterium]|nr:hypothetical protein [Alphaproteobacteria bacterium]